MNTKLLGTALVVVTAAMSAGCGILQTVKVPKLKAPQFRFDSNTYVVQPGDTLESVAGRYKIDPDSLAAVNSLELAKLVPGQRLILLRERGKKNTAIASNTETSPPDLTADNVQISDVQAGGVGSTVVVPSAAQKVPSVIGTDIIAIPEGSEEVVKVVKVPSGDDLLDDQAIFSSELPELPPELPTLPELPELPPVVAQNDRPEGVETVVRSVEVDPLGSEAVMIEPVEIPSSGSVNIADASAQNTSKRITVNNHADGWNWPAIGLITQDFDLREINRQGVDIDPGPGAGVQAAADGEVVYSGRDLASYGNLVILRHDNNFLSAYSKVSDIFVTENQRVKAGDLIASVGDDSTGGTELHFEIRRNGEPVNPVEYLPAL